MFDLRKVTRGRLGLILLVGAWPEVAASHAVEPQASAPPSVDRQKDRGEGIPTSMFGTYVRPGELVIYPFVEYYRDHNYEYAPSELGYPGDTDFRGKYRASEGLVFLAYGVSDRLVVELEAAVIRASLQKAPGDGSTLPSKLSESGFGDFQTQINWRWSRETEQRPEVFSYAEIDFPHHKERPLTGTPDWAVKVGSGVVRGFPWGTMTARAALELDFSSSSPLDLGEWAVEYLKAVSPKWRVYAGVEGSIDELAFIAEVQWRPTKNVTVKLNNGFGLTSKTTDWEPEVGIMFSFPTR